MVWQKTYFDPLKNGKFAKTYYSEKNMENITIMCDTCCHSALKNVV